MTYYSRFGEGLQEDLNQLVQRRNLLIEQLKGFMPDNIAELLTADPDHEVTQELAWVEIPDPRDNGKLITVRPVLGYWLGETAEESTSPSDMGLSSLLLEGRLPSGEEHVIGTMGVFFQNGALKYEPNLSINTSSRPSGETVVNWESADALLWLTLAETAIDAQPSL